VGRFDSYILRQIKGSMTSKEVLNKAYGNIPKDVGVNFDLSWVPTPRGVKYYWLVLVRKITR
jgi:hypothetical protein